MKTLRVLVVGIVLAGVLLTLQAPPRALAQEPPPAPTAPTDDQAAQDPPGQVAQLSYSTGSVSFQAGGEGDWVQAVPNRPLTTGDNLWADKDSRAELNIGSTAIRMDSQTSVTFLQLDDTTTQIKLSLGSLIVRVRHLDDGDVVEVDAPNLAFDIQRTGEYRFDVNENGDETDVAVWQGRGEATGGGASYVVVAGQRAQFSGTDQLDHEIAQLPAADDFDTWSSDRDQREERSESANYVSPEVTGYENLDGYGSWTYVAGYGPCWTPTVVAAGWAPYRYGHWVWISPWGWTWVEDEPWGFAPFHYGRWTFVRERWYWVPGGVYVRPVYAPALVAFVGGGGFHLSVSVGGPGVAWFPLAPGEVYMPWYRTSRRYVDNVNITNTRVNVTQVTNVYNIYNSRTNVTQITYANRHMNAVTAVSRDTFVNARPVSKNFVRVDERQMASAPVTYRVDEQPVRASMRGAGAPARVRPPETIVDRRVVVTRTPAFSRAPLQQSRRAVNVPEAAAPQQPTTRRETEVRPTPTNPRYEVPRPTPRPEATNQPAAPQSMARPQQPQRAEERPAVRPQNPQTMEQPPARSMVKPAPPVQERPDFQRNEEQKFHNWQQERQKSAPAPRPTSRSQQPSHSQPAPHNSQPSHSQPQGHGGDSSHPRR
jgi:Family of unknown function (DUF6600)/FecR protein